MSENPQDNSLDEFEESPSTRPQASRTSNNRPFVISIGVIGLILLIGIGLVIYLLLSRGSQQATQASDQAATVVAQNAAVAARATLDQKRAQDQQLTQEAIAKFTATPTLAPTSTVAAPAGASPTSVLAMPTATGTPTATVSADMATQTAVAQATRNAGGTGGNKGYPGPGTPGAGTPAAAGTPGAGTPQATPTGLPKTGFADEVGLPALFGVAALLVVIIFVARRARQGS